ncbi:MAG: discoidin domain-containing protein, partial [Gemmatimonadetes bacterium]|nr:discoidin domain-containing protein [Gemmatimonadota bacterium]
EHRTRSYVGVEPGMDGLPGPYAHPTVPTALYDLDNDVGETTDVSADHPDVVARLDALAEVARATLGDRLTGRVGSEVRPVGRRGFDRVARAEHLAVGATVTLTTPASSYYPGNGASILSDGVLGTRDHHDERWLGFSGDDLEAVVDLGAPRPVRRIGLDCLQNQVAWIFFPRWVEFAVSADGQRWETVGRVEVELEVDQATASRMVEAEVNSEMQSTPVRYVRVRARNLGTVPDWHPGAGGEAWLFVDEIVVEG